MCPSMPIAWKEIQTLKNSLEVVREELMRRFGTELEFAEFKPRPSDLFEYFVLYNSALALDPIELKTGHPFTRGDFRSTGWIPSGIVKSYRTPIKMGRTLVPNITCRVEGIEFNFWFDKTLAPRIRPDIVVRTGHFETGEDYAKGHFWLLKDGVLFAEYSLEERSESEGYFVERTTGTPKPGETVYFRAATKFKKPSLIIECKSYGARLGNPEVYADYARTVLLVSPEKLYEPKRPNIIAIRVNQSFENLELQEKLRPYLSRLIPC